MRNFARRTALVSVRTVRVMPTWDCWHRVEYRREVAVGHRTHEYTEIVEDAGWTFQAQGA